MKKRLLVSMGSCALVVLALMGWQSVKAQSAFVIPPYLFSIQGQHIGLAWRYPNVKAAAASEDPSDAVFFWNGRQAFLHTQNHNGLEVAELPIPACGFGDSAAYMIHGMTAPQKIAAIPCGGSSLVRFAMISDTQGSLGFDSRFMKMIAATPASALVVDGDLTDEGTSVRLWTGFFNALSPVIGSRVLIPVVGNHEYRKNAMVPAWPYFFDAQAHDAHYSVDLGNVHLIVLNSCFSDDPSLVESQLPWLENELQRPARWKMVVFHHPPYSRSVMAMPIYPKKEYLKLQQFYVPLFEKYKVDVVVNGHVHFYEHSIKNGVHYLTNGPAGGILGFVGAKNPFAVKFARTRTMLQVQASETALQVEVNDVNNQLIDEVRLPGAENN